MRYLQVCTALYDYEARTPDEINIKENDTLYVVEKEDDDWWKAEVKQTSNEEPGPIGLVPATYLEEVAPIGKVRAEYDYDAQQEEELSFSEGQDMWLLERDDPDWYLVKLDNGTIGLAPANYVLDIESITETPPTIITTTTTSPPTTHSPNPTPTSTVTPLPPLTQQDMQPKISTKDIDDEALSWTVHDYDVNKKKKKKSKGNLLVGNAMLCYGSETDKTCPVQQYPILDVSKYLFDGKNLHIEIDGTNPAVLDLQASSKSEAKAILVKITDSRKVAQVAGTRVSHKIMAAATTGTTPVSSSTPTAPSAPTTHDTQTAPLPASEPRWATSLYAFDAEGGEEISIEENQQILVTDYDRDDGWWRVETTDGRSGIIPTSYVEFYDNNETNQHTAATAPQPDHHQDDDVDREAHDEVEIYMREKERREREQQLALERQIEQSEQAEQRRRQVEAERAAAEEERLRMADQQRRDEEERERRRKVQEAAQQAEVVRQRQMEEERRKRETTTSRSSSSGGLSRSMSTRQDLPKPDPDRLRTWTDRSGSFKVEAQYLAYTDGKLRLHKANGVKIDVPLERMSAEDIRWVERRTNQPVGSTGRKGSQTNSAERTPEMPARPNPTANVTTPTAGPSSSNTNAKKTVNSSWDWFDWFMMIGIPMQEALIYSSAFKADNLDDSDLEKLTHKQMKMLGMKEEHVQRAERYIDTGKVEPLDDANETTEDVNAREKQIESDAEMARRLQESWESGSGKKAASRPKPSVSAPKDIHPDLLEFLGSSNDQEHKATSDTNTNASNNVSNDLIGFSDDAWAPRPTKESNPSQGQQPLMPQQAPPPPPPSQPVVDTAPAPAAPPAPPVFEPQPPAQVITTQQTSSSSTSTAPAQQSQSKTIDPSLLQWQTSSSSNGSPQPVSHQRPSLNQLSQQEELRKYQQQQRQQALLEQQQQIIMQQQQHIQQQQIQQQQNQLQQQQQQHQQQLQLQQVPLTTGFQPNNNSLVLHNNNLQQQQPQLQNYQVTGYIQQQQPTGMMTMSNTAAGQPMYQLPQATGRHWHTSTPDNPFGSPSISSQSLATQMTGTAGMQFSTPNPNAFNSSPMQQQQHTPSYLQQLQPQMTGIQQTELSGARDKYAAFRTPNADVFTPNGSMQYGQSGFPQQQGYQPGRGW